MTWFNLTLSLFYQTRAEARESLFHYIEVFYNRIRRHSANRSLIAVGLREHGLRNPSQLSMGERKRVCLAGVLECEPSMLVLDEPTSNLDPRARWQLLQILGQFSGTQIIATHDLDFVLEICQRVLVLDGGKLQSDGPTEQILANPILMENHGLEVPWRRRPRSR